MSNKITNQINQMEVLEMNKTQLRSLLSKQYGVKLAPSVFKSASKEDLMNMVKKAKVESASVFAGEKEEERAGEINIVSANMENGAGAITGGEATIVEEGNSSDTKDCSKILGIDYFADIVSLIELESARIQKHTTQEADRVIENVNKAIEKLNRTILSINKTNLSSNRVATRNNGRKQEICSCCGKVVSDAKVIDYSLRHYGKVMCYNCQPGKSTKAVKNTNSNKIVKTCMCCGKKVVFRDAEQLTEKSNKAKELNLTVIACAECWTKEFNAKKVTKAHTQSEPATSSQPNVQETPATEQPKVQDQPKATTTKPIRKEPAVEESSNPNGPKDDVVKNVVADDVVPKEVQESQGEVASADEIPEQPAEKENKNNPNTTNTSIASQVNFVPSSQIAQFDFDNIEEINIDPNSDKF